MRELVPATALLLALVACGSDPGRGQGGPGGAPSDLAGASSSSAGAPSSPAEAPSNPAEAPSNPAEASSNPAGAASRGTVALAEKVLAPAAEPPGNPDLFDSEKWYLDAVPMQRINTVLSSTEEGGRASLNELLGSRIEDAGVRAAALKRYDAPATKAVVAEPVLRAAMAYTAARFGDSLLPTTPPFSIIRIGGAPALATAVALQNYIVFNRNTLPELEALPGLVEHEAMHSDGHVGAAEESILNAHTSSRYFQALLDNPKLAHVKTAGARFMNTFLFFLLNSHDAGSAVIRLQAPAGGGVAPGGAREVKNYWDVGWVFGHDFGDSPMPAAFRDLIARELKGEADVPASLTFDAASGQLFDRVLARRMPPVDRVRVLVLLQAMSVADVARLSDLSEEKAIATFGLTRFLEAIPS